MVLLIAATLAMPGDPMERASLEPLAEHGFSEGDMAFFPGAVGVLRVTALWLNGHIDNGITKPNGADIRAVCSGLCALVMGQLTLALVVDAFTAEAPSYVIPVFGTLTIFVGVVVAATCVAMVLQANTDKREVPAPAPGSVGDTMVHLQGPARADDSTRLARDRTPAARAHGADRGMRSDHARGGGGPD
ncbi:hypothetical protein [Methylobacterium sp. ap11]|uniref:hypothetical protein n=1 Tax=Methylobacterium sp. ap11 TaxID=1761799 RepID=UPI0015A5EAF1|nr:hypothetical protein [Methylobacterium sp. ap11]